MTMNPEPPLEDQEKRRHFVLPGGERVELLTAGNKWEGVDTAEICAVLRTRHHFFVSVVDTQCYTCFRCTRRHFLLLIFPEK